MNEQYINERVKEWENEDYQNAITSAGICNKIKFIAQSLPHVGLGIS